VLLGTDNGPNRFRNVDPSLHAEAESIRQRVPEYFQRLVQSNPEVTGAGKLTSLWREGQDGERTQSLCKEVYKAHIRLLDHDLSDVLSTRLWVLGHYYPGASHTAVFAAYDDGQSLWLDNHIDNQDFDRFWQRENIVWESADEAAAFMMATKFHYLREPSRMYIVSNVSDIPQEHREFLKTYDDEEHLRKFDKDLAAVAPHIYPPSLDTVQGTTHLQFCVWLMAGGRLLSIQCRFDPEGKLSYEGEQLGEWMIGDGFMPR
jgi:hypothetical protein